MTITLNAEPRTASKAVDIRKKGLFPAVYYGKKEKATPIQMSHADFLKVWKEAGESSVISIKLPGGHVDALIHDVQYEPVSGQPVHADFYVFEKGHKVEISIPLEFINESPAVKAGGVLVKSLHELKIKADPSNIPHELMADLATLVEIGNDIFAKDIKLPAGVELMENPEEVVASVSMAREEVVEEAPMDLSAIEVEKKGKKDEESEGTSEEAK